jgi:two-component system response regulator GlrR
MELGRLVVSASSPAPLMSDVLKKGLTRFANYPGGAGREALRSHDELTALFPDRYRLIQLLGEGGEGRVYLVEDLARGGTRLALKAVAFAGGLEGSERLVEEFLTLSSLAHPSLARVRDFGYLGGHLGAYFTADHVAGKGLVDWFAWRGVEAGLAELELLAAQALSVLHYCHVKGIEHGDVKPENLLVEQVEEGEAEQFRLRLIDFGSARLLRTLRDRRRLGTPAYLPAGGIERDGFSADLYGLGMSLFHALAGRLPFAFGERQSLEAWWQSGEAAIPSRWRSDVSETLDILVRRLTSPASGERFRDSGEALEFLRGRGRVARPGRPAGAAAGLYGREVALANLLSRIRSRTGGVVILGGGEGSGKSSLLAALGARAQIEGESVVSLESPGDVAGMRELLRLVASEGASPVPEEIPDELKAAEVIARLGHRVILLVDGADSPSLPPLLLELLRHAAVNRRRGRGLLVLLATRIEPAALREALALPPEVESLELEPLGRKALAEIAADYFSVAAVPEALVDLLERHSLGLPGPAHAALQALAQAGAGADFLGVLQFPAELRLEATGRQSRESAWRRLGATRRRQLALLAVAGAGLSAPEAAAFFPELTEEEWLLGFEDLYRRGFVRRSGAALEKRYGLAPGARDLPLLERLPAEEVLRLRASIATRLFEPGELLAASSPERCASLARQMLALKRPAEAAMLAVRACRLLLRQSRIEEALDLLASVLASRPSSEAPSRFEPLVRLRAADLALKRGRASAGLAALESDASLPRWYQLEAGDRRARLLEQSGETARAARELERLSRGLARAGGAAAPQRATRRLEAKARLARLYFLLGESGKGRAALGFKSKLLEERILPAQAVRVTRALGLLASLEVRHGSPERAGRLLERALELAESTGRDDLKHEPLNALAMLHAGNGRLREACRLFAELEELALRRGDRMGRLQALYNQGYTCYRMQDLERAEEIYRRASSIADDMGRHTLSPAVWIGLAVVLRERGRLLEALRLYRRVLRLGALAGSKERTMAHNNLGEIYLSLGRLERSLSERRQAVALARGSGNQFLLGLTLRGLGSTLLALGQSAEARAALEEGIDVEKVSADARHIGGSFYYLGLLAALAGETGKAFALWRRSLHESRRAADRAFQEASLLALLDLLVSRGRRRLALRLLGRMLDRRRSLPPRWPILTQALMARAGGSPVGGGEELVQVLRRGEMEGQLWQTLLALQQALRDPALGATLAAEIEERRHMLCLRLSGWIPAESVPAFRRFWLSADPEASRGAESPVTPAPVPLLSTERPSALADAWLESGDPREAGRVIERVLGSLKARLGAGGVWLIGAPRDDFPFQRAPGSKELPERLLAAGQKPLEEARSRRQVLDHGGSLLLAIGSRGERFLHAEPAVGEGSLGASAERICWFEDAALTLDLVFRLLDAVRELGRQRTLEAQAREELRRLSALLGKEKRLLDTVPIGGRLEAGSAGLTPPVAASRAMREIMSLLPRLAALDLPVLFLGESGVGKDLLARWLHSLSPRRDRPFLGEICSLPESLLEAELFGYVEGAFTGAVGDRPGLFHRVDGGTLYLDEIADLSPALQSRLVRVLQTKRIRPLGSEAELPIDFRLISSSRSMDLSQLVVSGLRPDLLHRLRGQIIVIPPLRDRPEDILEIVERTLSAHARARGVSPPYLHPQARRKLLSHDWPGNVRELENELERALVESSGELAPEHILLALSPATPPARDPKEPASLLAARNLYERELVIAALRQCRGNASEAARSLKITRRYLGKLLSKHQIDLVQFRLRG